MRDLIVKDDDLAIATHGRGFWILDNITPLRQLAPGLAEASPSGGTSFRSSNLKTRLFKPQTALRVRWDTNTDTPLPPDEPAGENPPEGAMIDYSLGQDVSGPIVLEIKDAKGKVVRHYASSDPAPTPDPKLKIPRYWVRPPQQLSAKPGLHRFLWDLHGQPLAEITPEYPMTAVERETVPRPTAPWVLPGNYTVALTIGGKILTQPLVVKMDPRVKASPADLVKQFEASQKLAELREKLEPIGKQYDALVRGLERIRQPAKGKGIEIEGLWKKLEDLASPAAVREERLELDVLNKVRKSFDDLQQVDAAPTSQQEAAVPELEKMTGHAMEAWKAIAREVEVLNGKLRADGLQSIAKGNDENEA